MAVAARSAFRNAVSGPGAVFDTESGMFFRRFDILTLLKASAELCKWLKPRR
jgi:hypothetical protein